MKYFVLSKINSTAWRRKSGIMWKKTSDYEVMTQFFIGLFGRNSNLTSGETFSGVEWYTRPTPIGAFKRKSYIFHESFLDYESTENILT